MKFADLVLPGDQRWLKAQYYDWLEAKRTKAFAKEEAKWLTHILTKNEERVRTGSWSVSSAGRCLREQELVYRGYKKGSPGLQLLNIFRNGDYMHLRHQVAGLMQGYLTDIEVPVEIPSFNAKGTIDGMCSDGVVVDFKSMNSYGFDNLLEPHADHVRQLHGYMRATGTTKSRILYENKNNQELKEFSVEFSEEVDAQNRSDWKEMQDDIDSGRLAPYLEPHPACSLRDCKHIPEDAA